MLRAHTVEQVRAAERALMAGLAEGVLMQRAAFGLSVVCARVLRHETARVSGSRVVLLVGSGDNGGDTMLAGALLARRGARVAAVLLGRPHEAGLQELHRAGGTAVSVRTTAGASGLGDAEGLLRRADLVMDGIVGIGGKPGLRHPADLLVQVARQRGAPMVAVDLPSGIAVDSGQTPATRVRADVTVTFGTHKVGLLVDPAAAAAGRVELVDIGLDPYLPAPALTALDGADVAGLLAGPGRDEHKYSRGVVAVRAGSPAFAGAAVLTVGGAIRGGAGLVRLVASDGVAELVRGRWPEAVLTEGRTDAWAVGPGLGSGAGTAVTAALGSGLPTVLDADALVHVPECVGGPLVLTPHAGELARMLGTTSETVLAERLASVTEAARRWDTVVLLKGSTTLVAAPDGRVRANLTGTPWLATAGSGDVLTGLIGALLAGGLAPFDAAAVGAFLHGRAGRLAAEASGAPSAGDLLHPLGLVRQHPDASLRQVADSRPCRPTPTVREPGQPTRARRRPTRARRPAPPRAR